MNNQYKICSFSDNNDEMENKKCVISIMNTKNRDNIIISCVSVALYLMSKINGKKVTKYNTSFEKLSEYIKNAKSVDDIYEYYKNEFEYKILNDFIRNEIGEINQSNEGPFKIKELLNIDINIEKNLSDVLSVLEKNQELCNAILYFCRNKDDIDLLKIVMDWPELAEKLSDVSSSHSANIKDTILSNIMDYNLLNYESIYRCVKDNYHLFNHHNAILIHGITDGNKFDEKKLSEYIKDNNIKTNVYVCDFGKWVLLDNWNYNINTVKGLNSDYDELIKNLNNTKQLKEKIVKNRIAKSKFKDILFTGKDDLKGLKDYISFIQNKNRIFTDEELRKINEGVMLDEDSLMAKFDNYRIKYINAVEDLTFLSLYDSNVRDNLNNMNKEYINAIDSLIQTNEFDEIKNYLNEYLTKLLNTGEKDFYVNKKLLIDHIESASIPDDAGYVNFIKIDGDKVEKELVVTKNI